MTLHPGHRSMRLIGHDYRCGLYFVTVCRDGRRRLFGSVAGGRVALSLVGQCASETWRSVGAHQPLVVLDMFVVMPDHVHLSFRIVSATDPRGDDHVTGDRVTGDHAPDAHSER